MIMSLITFFVIIKLYMPKIVINFEAQKQSAINYAISDNTLRFISDRKSTRLNSSH